MSRRPVWRRIVFAGTAVGLGLLGATAAGAGQPHSAFAAPARQPALGMPPPTLLPNLPLPTSLPSLPVALPTLPLPSPTLPLPSPSLPVPGPSLAPPTPPLGGVPEPSPPPSPPLRISQRDVAYQGTPPPGAQGERGPSRILIPAIAVPDGPLGAALLVAVAALPLLLGIALISIGRVWGNALQLRSGRLRMALASELDLRPRELAALTPAGLVKLRDQVAFDEVSGVLRRAAGVAAVEREVARAQRTHSPLSAVFVDLDGLKRVNDSKGHGAGDAFIRAVATLLRESLRRQDLVFRYGGDEFVCLLPGVGSPAATEKFAQLRARAVESSIPFSFGAAELHAHEDLVSFLGRADQRLYEQRAEQRGSTAGGQVVPMPGTHSGGRRSGHRDG